MHHAAASGLRSRPVLSNARAVSLWREATLWAVEGPHRTAALSVYTAEEVAAAAERACRLNAELSGLDPDAEMHGCLQGSHADAERDYACLNMAGGAPAAAEEGVPPSAAGKEVAET